MNINTPDKYYARRVFLLYIPAAFWIAAAAAVALYLV